MSTPFESKKNEQPSTYIVPDRQNQDELARLMVQDHMLTASMGGVLPEQENPARFQHVLDVGCGSGSWVIEAAQTYPSMSLVGVDISKRMVDYARNQAQQQQVSDRVTFQVMDALRMLEFPSSSFDLVNLRFAVSFMRTWDWPKMLAELMRVTRPNGIIRIVDQQIAHEANKLSSKRFGDILLCALYRAGHLFEEESTGLSAHLAPLLTQCGCQQVQTRPFALTYRAGTPEFQAYAEDIKHTLKTFLPFFQKWGCIPDDFQALYQQGLIELDQPDFSSTWHLLAAWGTKP